MKKFKNDFKGTRNVSVKDLCSETMEEFIEGLKKADEEKNAYLDITGKKKVRIKKSYIDSLLEWHKPRTEKEERWYIEHENKLATVRKTGKCPCGESVEPGSGNILLDLGYLYGIECLSCR